MYHKVYKVEKGGGEMGHIKYKTTEDIVTAINNKEVERVTVKSSGVYHAKKGNEERASMFKKAYALTAKPKKLRNVWRIENPDRELLSFLHGITKPTDTEDTENILLLLFSSFTETRIINILTKLKESNPNCDYYYSNWIDQVKVRSEEIRKLTLLTESQCSEGDVVGHKT